MTWQPCMFLTTMIVNKTCQCKVKENNIKELITLQEHDYPVCHYYPV